MSDEEVVGDDADRARLSAAEGGDGGADHCSSAVVTQRSDAGHARQSAQDGAGSAIGPVRGSSAEQAVVSQVIGCACACAWFTN